LENLRRVLDGSMAMTVEEAGSHRHCPLGKWIYSTGLGDYGGLPEIQALEKAHEHFHKIVSDVVTRKNANEQEKAEAGLKELGGASENVLSCLGNAEKKVQETQNVNIVVLQADGRQFGMVVDEINDTEEIVVKPLGKQLKSITCFAGATIMGDGKVALILDVLGLAQHANVIAETHDRSVTGKSKGVEKSDDRQTLLLFDAGQHAHMAIPLSMVARLEEFPRKLVERSGNQEVVQYRGQILPLIQIAKYLPSGVTAAAPSDPLQVVVYSEGGRSVGLIVGKINDIVQESLTVKRNAVSDGILGSAVVHEKVTDLLDVISIIRAADPSFYQAANKPVEAKQ
jgi:chemotaxis protein histidine kinase CheA